MRRCSAIWPFLAVMLWLPATAWSQDDDFVDFGGEAAEPDDPPAEEPGDEEPIGYDPAGAPPDVGTPSGNAPTEHVVEEGDTLWDLCKRYLNNPWYWPKIWSYNPQIENPHWIYPGNRIRFYPGAGALPSQMEPVGEGELSGEIDDFIEIEGSGDLDDVELFDAPLDLPEKLARMKREGQVMPSRMMFVSDQDIKNSGVISASFEDSQLLTLFQRMYIKLKSSAQPGQRFEIFRVNREVRHPVNGSRVGYLIEILGQATIERLDSKVGTAVIDAAYNEIQRGDLLGPATFRADTFVPPKPASRNLKGYIVDTTNEGSSIIGESFIVFVDVGAKDGVEIGNLFYVVRAGDGFTGETKDLPDEDIGRLLVLDTRDKVSTAMVTYSNRELFAGDRVELRAQ